MKSLKVYIFITLFLALSACSSTRSTKNLSTLPPIRYEKEITLSKEIEKKDSKAIPSKQVTEFTTEDPEVVASIKLKNVSGKHKLRWEWYDPNGKLYYSTGNYTIKTSKDTYREEVTALHRLAIRGDKAANYPGKWQVQVYLDGEPFDSRNFKIEMDIHTLPDIAVKPNPKNWGLIIGIEEYAHLPSVDYATNDALMIEKYFTKVLGVPEENIISLLDSKATKSTIKGKISSYLSKNVEKDTTLYVYFAGHGLPYTEKEKEPEPYLVAYDGDITTITETGYKLKSFYEDLNALELKKSFVFLDACFSGPASRGERMLVAGTRPMIIEVEPTLFSDKLISLTAATGGEMSNAYPEKEHGLFTFFLLKGLRGEADTDENGSLNMQELHAYVKDNVRRVSRRKGLEQTPALNPSSDTVKDVEIIKVLKK